MRCYVFFLHPQHHGCTRLQTGPDDGHAGPGEGQESEPRLPLLGSLAHQARGEAVAGEGGGRGAGQGGAAALPLFPGQAKLVVPVGPHGQQAPEDLQANLQAVVRRERGGGGGLQVADIMRL